MADLQENRKNMRIMRLIINPANYLWTKKGIVAEAGLFQQRFMATFMDPKYKKLLFDDF